MELKKTAAKLLGIGLSFMLFLSVARVSAFALGAICDGNNVKTIDMLTTNDCFHGIGGSNRAQKNCLKYCENEYPYENDCAVTVSKTEETCTDFPFQGFRYSCSCYGYPGNRAPGNCSGEYEEIDFGCLPNTSPPAGLDYSNEKCMAEFGVDYGCSAQLKAGSTCDASDDLAGTYYQVHCYKYDTSGNGGGGGGGDDWEDEDVGEPCTGNFLVGYLVGGPTYAGINSGIGCIPTNWKDLSGWALSLALGFGGAIAILLIMVGGYKVMTSQGDPEKLEDGKGTLTAAISGLIFIILSVTIYQIVVGTLFN